jgi:ABC-type cobalamin transport system permease subunit
MECARIFTCCSMVANTLLFNKELLVLPRTYRYVAMILLAQVALGLAASAHQSWLVLAIESLLVLLSLALVALVLLVVYKLNN